MISLVRLNISISIISIPYNPGEYQIAVDKAKIELKLDEFDKALKSLASALSIARKTKNLMKVQYQKLLRDLRDIMMFQMLR